MKILFLFMLFLLGCPKKDKIDLIEEERRASLKKMMEEDDEFYDDIPESEEKTENKND